MKLLHIDSSILAANSVSRQLTAEHRRPVAGQPPRHRRSSYLDLAVDAPSHLAPDSLGFRLPARPTA